MAIEVGSLVRVKPPFDEGREGVVEVTALSETGAWQIDGVDFAEEHLEEVI
jgi:hypothetical protein